MTRGSPEQQTQRAMFEHPAIRAAARPTYVLPPQAAPGRDGVRSLRALLKTAGRRCGLRALSIRKLPPPPPRNSRPTSVERRRPADRQ
jgi:hypothetical protein